MAKPGVRNWAACGPGWWRGSSYVGRRVKTLAEGEEMGGRIDILYCDCAISIRNDKQMMEC